MASADILFRLNKQPRSCIKRERVEEGRENNLVKKYRFYQNGFQWLIAVIFNRQISKHYRVRHESQSQRNFQTCQAVWSEFDFVCRKFLTKPLNLFNSWAKQSLIKYLMTEITNCRIQPKKNIYKPLFHHIFKTSKQRENAIQRVLRKYNYKLKTYSKTPAFNTYIKICSHEIANKQLRVRTTKTLWLPTWKTYCNAEKCASGVKKNEELS